MSVCKIHNVRFYKPRDRSIYNIALKKSQKKLAISRSDNTIEIWDVSHTAVIEKTVYPTPDNSSVEHLTWAGEKLFSVGLHGLLVEYDLYKLNIKAVTSLTGGAAYCIASNQKNQIAIGTEQGYVNVFNVAHETMFDSLFDKQEGEIVCIKFDKTGDYLVTGGNDAIRIWDVASGHAIHKMTTGRSELNKPTIVWCLAVASDFTIVSGDSRGKITFWDGKMGAQIESYQSHRADVLSVCLSEDEKSLYCAGADPCISNYVLVSVKDGSKKWVRSIQRRIHEHDVRALVLINQRLYSGGIDGYLACSYHPPKTLLKYPPIMQNSCTRLSNNSRQILLRYPTSLEVWKLGESEKAQKEQRGVLPVGSEPKKLLVLQKTVKGEEDVKVGEGISTACISNDGQWIVFSTCSGTTLVFYHSLPNSDKRSLKRIPFEGSLTQCVNSVFTNDSSQLILAPNNGGLDVYKLKNESFDLAQHVQFEASEICDTIVHLIPSRCGKFLIVGDASSNIAVYVHKAQGWESYFKLPKYNEPLTAIGVHPTLLNVVIAYSDNKIVEWSIKKRTFTPYSRTLQTNPPKTWSTWTHPVRNITFDTKNNNVIILHDDNNIIIINKDKNEKENAAKLAKLENGKKSNNGGYQEGCYTINKYKHLVNLDWLSSDEMVAVEVNPLQLFEQLPPAFEIKAYGTK